VKKIFQYAIKGKTPDGEEIEVVSYASFRYGWEEARGRLEKDYPVTEFFSATLMSSTEELREGYFEPDFERGVEIIIEDFEKSLTPIGAKENLESLINSVNILELIGGKTVLTEAARECHDALNSIIRKGYGNRNTFVLIHEIWRRVDAEIPRPVELLVVSIVAGAMGGLESVDDFFPNEADILAECQERALLSKAVRNGSWKEGLERAPKFDRYGSEAYKVPGTKEYRVVSGNDLLHRHPEQNYWHPLDRMH